MTRHPDLKLLSGMMLLATLAACGGDQSGSTEAPSSSTPKAEPTQTMTEPFTQDTIRGDVLATALAQMPVAPAGRRPATIGLGRVEGDTPGDPNAASALILRQWIGRDRRGLGAYVSDTLHQPRGAVGMDAVRAQFGLSHAGVLPRTVLDGPANAVVLTLGKTAHVARQSQNADGSLGAAERKTLSADADIAIRRNTAYWKHTGEIGSWRAAGEDTSTALNFQGRPLGEQPANEFTLCNTVVGFGKKPDCAECALPRVTRTVCTTWQVPDGWQPGKALVARNLSISEARERLIFDSEGQPYDMRRYDVSWRTVGDAPFGGSATPAP